MSIDRESNWILNQLKLARGGNNTPEEGTENELSILKEDIKRFLELVRVEKLDVSIKSQLNDKLEAPVSG